MKTIHARFFFVTNLLFCAIYAFWQSHNTFSVAKKPFWDSTFGYKINGKKETS
jgi:hypothetical protein